MNNKSMLLTLLMYLSAVSIQVVCMEQNHALRDLANENDAETLDCFTLFIDTGKAPGQHTDLGIVCKYPKNVFCLPHQEFSSTNEELANKIFAIAQGEPVSDNVKQSEAQPEEPLYDIYFAPIEGTKNSKDIGWIGFRCLVMPTLTKRVTQIIKDFGSKWINTSEEYSDSEITDLECQKFLDGSRVDYEKNLEIFYKGKRNEFLQKYQRVVSDILEKYEQEVRDKDNKCYAKYLKTSLVDLIERVKKDDIDCTGNVLACDADHSEFVRKILGLPLSSE